MDLNYLVDRMPEEEREVYLHKSASEYYHFLEEQEEFSTIEEKLSTEEILNEKEWLYIFYKLYLVSCRALMEEENYTLVDRVLYLLTKLGMKVCKKDGGLYNECYKMMEYLTSIKREHEINLDLFHGIDNVMDTCSETDLDRLIKQYRLANVFRDNKDAFQEAYHASDMGYISGYERMYIHACHKAYEEEKVYAKEWKKEQS